MTPPEPLTVPLFVSPTSVPPPSTIRTPPASTSVEDATPPERMVIVPPLSTVSLVSVCPAETLYDEPLLTVTVLMNVISFRWLVRAHRCAKCAGGLATRAFFVSIESERKLYLFILTDFLHANRYPPRIKSGAGSRIKSGAGFRWKTL